LPRKVCRVLDGKLLVWPSNAERRTEAEVLPSCLVGRSSGRAYALGGPIRVRVENVSISRRQIDLVAAETRTATDEDTVEAYQQGSDR